jgi:uncharacterized protein YjbI with pentapeptide repeats
MNESELLSRYASGERDFRGANLSCADLRGATLRDANLRGAHLSCADLRDATLRGADLRGANLSCADLSCANLRGANLRGANLRGADLRGADLSCADLSYADLSYADLRGATLRGADLSKTGIVRLYTSYEATIYPDGRIAYGCEIHSIDEWKDKLDDLCEKHEPSRSQEFKAEITVILALAAVKTT